MKKVIFLIIIFFLFLYPKEIYADEGYINLKYNSTKIEIDIEDTNCFDINNNKKMEYIYHDSENKKGLWYINKETDKNYINITEYNAKELKGDFTINSIIFKNVNITLENEKGELYIKNNDKYLKGIISFKNSEYLSIIINSNKKIYGLVGIFSNNKNLKYNDCITENNFEINSNGNKVLFESVKGIDKGIIGICNFEKKGDDIGYIYLNDISISNYEKEILHNNVSLKISEPKIKDIIYNKVNKYIKNNSPKKNKRKWILPILLLIFIIIFFIFIVLKNNKNKQIKIIIFLVFFIPIQVFAIDNNKIDDNYINKIRKEILNQNSINSEEIINYDLDKDNKITINDLIVAKNIYNIPKIKFIDGVIKKNDNYNYYTEVNKKIEITSISEIKTIKYCITTNDSCEPNLDYASSGNKVTINIKLPDEKEKQKICVKVNNIIDFENFECENKNYLVDSKKPYLKVKNDKIYIGENEKYDLNSNVEPIYGISGGKYNCTGKVEQEKNIINCDIIGNNGLSAKTKYEIYISATHNKTAIFFGDSITYGYGNNGYGWANYIADNYDILNAVNAGKSGWFISNNLKRDWIVNEVNSRKNTNYDYVIMHGGCNDINKNVPLGTYEETNFSGNYDTDTFLGGLEYYLYVVTTNWQHAKIGYIINYKTPNDQSRNNEKSAPYYTKMKEVLNKWNIKYIDLFDGSNNNGQQFAELLKVNTNEYLPDNLHLNGEGYRIISPYIYNWMKTLSNYK